MSCYNFLFILTDIKPYRMCNFLSIQINLKRFFTTKSFEFKQCLGQSDGEKYNVILCENCISKFYVLKI